MLGQAGKLRTENSYTYQEENEEQAYGTGGHSTYATPGHPARTSRLTYKCYYRINQRSKKIQQLKYREPHRPQGVKCKSCHYYQRKRYFRSAHQPQWYVGKVIHEPQ